MFGFGGREAVGLAIVVIAVLTLAFILSAISGCTVASSGSPTPTWCWRCSCCFLFVLGPTVFILNTFVESIGGYLANIIPMSFRTASYGDSDFVSGWTVFYWAWWISGRRSWVFIARISRGRTIREFVFGVILAPAWSASCGSPSSAGRPSTCSSRGRRTSPSSPRSQPAALFLTLQQFPLFWLTAA